MKKDNFVLYEVYHIPENISVVGTITSFTDEGGGDYDEEFALIKESGVIKLRDKAHDGKSYVSPKPIVDSHVETHPSHSQFDADQQARLEAHRRRISTEEGLLRSKGINPCRMHTAGKFDELAI